MVRPKKRKENTPIRSSLETGSELLSKVEDGMGAIAKPDRVYFSARIRAAFGDSLNLDEAFRESHPKEHRWDYLLGHEASHELVAVEPHSAKQDEIATVIGKRAAAKGQLRSHLEDGVFVSKWLWVASGRVHFADTEKARRRLDQNGVQFVGTRVDAKHLPVVGPRSGKRRRRD